MRWLKSDLSASRGVLWRAWAAAPLPPTPASSALCSKNLSRFPSISLDSTTSDDRLEPRFDTSFARSDANQTPDPGLRGCSFPTFVGTSDSRDRRERKSRFCDWQIEARSPWRGGWPARRASRLGARRMFAAYQGGPFVEVFTPQVRLRRETPSLDDTRVSRRPRRPCSTRGKISDWCPGKVRDPRGGARRTPPRPLERRSRLPRVGPERDRDPSRWSSVVQSASRPRLGARRGCDADSSSDVSRVPRRVDSPPDPRRALLSRAFLRAR